MLNKHKFATVNNLSFTQLLRAICAVVCILRYRIFDCSVAGIAHTHKLKSSASSEEDDAHATRDDATPRAQLSSQSALGKVPSTKVDCLEEFATAAAVRISRVCLNSR